ncbi:redox-regulated ATPase YchF [Kiloniella antarctica]|uniref:Ribosome-binding ATPase YchF n=1 Tax=Kiloniella antarctica TaxID=1550907 RepID=A0ABW5BGI4_9PROT
MGFNCGIVGLPNVGKSTLFNALTETAAAEAANYPFCTIEPNVGRVSVPDPRLDQIAKIANSQKIIPTQLEFVDIAGLVRGASKGEGMGNEFLGNIRSVDAIVHVVRCFDGEVTHVDGSVDPIRDADTVETELMIADLDSVEKQIVTNAKRAKGNDKEAKAKLEVLNAVCAVLQDGKPARTAEITKDQQDIYEQLQLLTSKPVLYVANVEEENAATGNAYSKLLEEKAATEGGVCVIISAAIEAEVASLSDEEEKTEFLSDLGLEETGLKRIISAGYGLLGLLTFFTVGPKEARAWTVVEGSTAPNAAGAIHTDFERGFIRAETIAFDDYIACNGEQGAKDAGKMRAEGKEYITKDGDIFHFRFNV